MEKAKFTKQEAKSFNLYIDANKHSTKGAILENYIQVRGSWIDFLVPLRDMGTEKFATALYIGYEVEMTPEEKLIEYYEELTEKSYPATARTIVQHTLDILGIRIKGVNA